MMKENWERDIFKESLVHVNVGKRENNNNNNKMFSK